MRSQLRVSLSSPIRWIVDVHMRMYIIIITIHVTGKKLFVQKFLKFQMPYDM